MKQAETLLFLFEQITREENKEYFGRKGKFLILWELFQ